MASRQDFKHPQNQGWQIYDSASIWLPSGSGVTRSVKQLALLEPCAIELERQWQEQKVIWCTWIRQGLVSI